MTKGIPNPSSATIGTRTSPRILLITAASPEIGVGGGVTATQSIINTLDASSIGADVDILSLRTGASKLPHTVRQMVAIARSAVSHLSSKSLFDFSSDAEHRLRSVDFSSYDLAIINAGELFFIADYLPQELPCIGLAHNVESTLFEARTKSIRRFPIVGRFLEKDLQKLRRTEIEGLERFGRVICLSHEDAKHLQKMSPSLRTLELPTTFSYEPHSRGAGRSVGMPIRLGFLAKYSWWPNREAVEWILGEVLPELPPGRVEVLLYGPGAERFAGRDPAVKIRGFVEDLAQVWNESDIVICPMHSGSGINIKFIEAIYNGCPVLATSYAKRGLPGFNDPAVVFLDSAKEWQDFLLSKQALLLSRNAPKPETSALFSINHGTSSLASFLDL